MLNIFRVSFFGHRNFYEHNKCEKILKEILEEILESKEYVEFFVGRNGGAFQSIKYAQKNNNKIINLADMI